MEKQNKEDYQKGFNTAYQLRRFHGISLIQQLSVAINKQESSYSKGFMDGLIEAEKNIIKEKQELRERQFQEIQKARIVMAERRIAIHAMTNRSKNMDLDLER